MDFPINLGSLSFVTGQEEFKQCMYILLKEEVGKFLQDFKLGSHIVIHSSDSDLIEENIRKTLEQIPGCVITTIDFTNDEEVELVVKYKDQLIDFKFNINEINGESTEQNGDL